MAETDQMSTPALTPHPPAPAPSSSSGNKAAKSTPSVSTVSSGLKYQEMSPEVTMVEFISTSASYHGVKEMDICQLEWDILSVFQNNIMPANAGAWYMAKRRYYMDNDYANQLLPCVLKNYPKKFAVKGQTVEFLEVYAKDVARKKLAEIVTQGLVAYFTHKVEEYGVYFFDPHYYETTEPYHANLRAVTKSPHVHRSKLLPEFFQMFEKQFVYQQHSPYLVTISHTPVEVKVSTIGVIVSMVDNQFGVLQFPSGAGTEKAFFSAKSLFKDGWSYQGDPMKLPPMEFDGYRVPTGSGCNDYTWYAVLVWCGRKPSPKYCSTKEDLTSSPYFQNNQMMSGSILPGNLLNSGRVTYEDLVKTKDYYYRHHHKKRDSQKGGCMQVGEVLNIRKYGAVVSLGKDTGKEAFICGWSHRNTRFPGSTFLSTTQGVELALKDLITFCLDPAASDVNGISSSGSNSSMPVGCNVTVLKHNATNNSNSSAASIMPAAASDPGAIVGSGGTGKKKKKVNKKAKAKKDSGSDEKKAGTDSNSNDRGQKSNKKTKKQRTPHYTHFLLVSDVDDEDDDLEYMNAMTEDLRYEYGKLSDDENLENELEDLKKDAAQPFEEHQVEELRKKLDEMDSREEAPEEKKDDKATRSENDDVDDGEDVKEEEEEKTKEAQDGDDKEVKEGDDKEVKEGDDKEDASEEVRKEEEANKQD